MDSENVAICRNWYELQLTSLWLFSNAMEETLREQQENELEALKVDILSYEMIPNDCIFTRDFSRNS